MIDLLEAMKIHPAFNTIREDLVGNSFDLNNAVNKAIDCLKQEAVHNASQHDWKCGYPDIKVTIYNCRGKEE